MIRALALVAVCLAVALVLLGGCSHTLNEQHGISNLIQIEPDVWRGGEPDDKGWTWLLDNNFCIRVQLDYDDERQAPPPSQIEIVRVPMPPNDADDLFKGPTKEQIYDAVRKLNDAIARARARRCRVIFGCRWGRDRTSVVDGWRRVLMWSWSKDQAWRYMLSTGYHAGLFGLTAAWRSLP